MWDSGDKFPCDCSITNNPGGTYTGREATVRVTYVTDCEMWGGREGHVCLSIAKKDEDDRARHVREAVEGVSDERFTALEQALLLAVTIRLASRQIPESAASADTVARSAIRAALLDALGGTTPPLDETGGKA